MYLNLFLYFFVTKMTYINDNIKIVVSAYSNI